MNQRIEYRAIIRRPASTLNTPEERERGWVEYPSGYAETKETITKREYELRRSEETHAYVRRWEKRTVEVGEWEEDES